MGSSLFMLGRLGKRAKSWLGVHLARSGGYIVEGLELLAFGKDCSCVVSW